MAPPEQRATIDLNDDQTTEQQESLLVVLGNPSATATIADPNNSTVFIIDNDGMPNPHIASFVPLLYNLH